ncbi:hypothetical protein E0Z10_g5561 [Xylaria hypoxylon]|uniref:Uncharacterized protein n=1 Tax=Xylaria hypoxylon TaxID=37992 RepID=A0A4Z0YVM5_9PEZI|nr:hypothetical protein E0Z10_g5561 [Xylaria hypoxylon]
MSFPRALQSLVFYLVSCSPCHQAAHQRRLKQEAKKRQATRERDQVKHGGYQQPEPFATNPYWLEEINLGPHIIRKQYKSPSMRHLTSAGGDTASVGSSSIVVNRVTTTASNATTCSFPNNTLTGCCLPRPESIPLPDSPPPTSTGTEAEENATITTTSLEKENEKPSASVGSGSIISITNVESPSPTSKNGKDKLLPDMTTGLPHNWNHKRYQREDEELWGRELSRTGHKLIDAIKHAGSSASRFIESSLIKDGKRKSDSEIEDKPYFVQCNPPVNDYHPPIVRQPPLKAGIRWMVQPPPPAKIMEGKVPVSRERKSIYSR